VDVRAWHPVRGRSRARAAGRACPPGAGLTALVLAAVHPLLAQVAGLPAFAGPTVAGVALAYGAGVAGIALWAGRRTRTADDFFVAGRGIGLIALTLSTLASNISGFAFIGGPGLVYALGMGAAWIILPAGITG